MFKNVIFLVFHDIKCIQIYDHLKSSFFWPTNPVFSWTWLIWKVTNYIIKNKMNYLTQKMQFQIKVIYIFFIRIHVYFVILCSKFSSSIFSLPLYYESLFKAQTLSSILFWFLASVQPFIIQFKTDDTELDGERDAMLPTGLTGFSLKYAFEPCL